MLHAGALEKINLTFLLRTRYARQQHFDCKREEGLSYVSSLLE